MRLKKEFRDALLAEEKLVRKVLNEVEEFNGNEFRLNTCKEWIRKNDERLTCYNFLLALSQLLELPVEALVTYEKD